MAADVSTGTSEQVVHESLVALGGGLEPLWREAAEQLRESPPSSAERARWGVAAARLTEALSSLEHFAGVLDPTLGRRDWASRRPSRTYLPEPRVPSSH
jgi:hypothetical protein